MRTETRKEFVDLLFGFLKMYEMGDNSSIKKTKNVIDFLSIYSDYGYSMSSMTVKRFLDHLQDMAELKKIDSNLRRRINMLTIDVHRLYQMTIENDRSKANIDDISQYIIENYEPDLNGFISNKELLIDVNDSGFNINNIHLARKFSKLGFKQGKKGFDRGWRVKKC